MNARLAILIPLLALSATANELSSVPAAVPTAGSKAQVQVEARFIEQDSKSGEEDVMSAPKVLTLNDQQAVIEIIREVPLVMAEDVAGATPRVVHLGVRMEVTPRILADRRILLQGLTAVRELPKESADNPTPKGQLFVNSRELHFQVLAVPGVPLILGGLEQNGRTLRVELRAREIPANNAAPIYWQAFAALPDKPEAKEGPDYERWLIDISPALDLLRTAAAKDGCDWDLDVSKGPELQLSHLSKARSLATAALARADVRAKHDLTGAVADISDALRLSRHISRDALLIAQLVRVSIEKLAAERIESLLPKLDPTQITHLRDEVSRLRPCPDLAACMELERNTFLGWIRAKLAAAKEGEVGGIMDSLGARENKWRSKKEVEKLLESTDADYQELIRIARLPQAEFTAAHAPWEAKLMKEREKRVLTALIVPAVAKAGEKFFEAETRLNKLLETLKASAGGGIQ